jgi:uncharacterized membrane protein YfcA
VAVAAHTIALAVITLTAAVVNGALGYGFSSITVPLALLFLANRVLNPAMVLIEVALNAYVLWVNRAALPAAGFRRPIRSERSAGLAFGGGLGVLYAVTTISGPPLAVMLNNQGLAKNEFRAALGFIRLAESTMTAIAYLYAGLFTNRSMALIPQILPSVAIGVPIGAQLIRHVRAETFRRLCMSFDAWVVGFGLSTLLRDLRLVESNAAYLVLVAVALIDAAMLYRFFSAQARTDGETASIPDNLTSAGQDARIVRD